MPELKVYLPEDLDRRFRMKAMSVYGYGRGSISKAAVDALAKWCTLHEKQEEQEASQSTQPSPETRGSREEAPETGHSAAEAKGRDSAADRENQSQLSTG